MKPDARLVLAAASFATLLLPLAGVGLPGPIYPCAIVLFVLALLALAGGEPGAGRPPRWAVGALALSLVAGTLLLLTHSGARAPRGWPLALALVIVGLVLAPLLVVALGHARAWKS